MALQDRPLCQWSLPRLRLAIIGLCGLSAAEALHPAMLFAQTASSPSPQRVLFRPAYLVKKDKLSGDMPSLPDAVKAARLGQSVLGTYKVCLDVSGSVASASPIAGIPGADEAIVTVLQQWKFTPQAVPVCYVEAFNFIVDGTPLRPAYLVKKDKLSGDMPPLPDAIKAARSGQTLTGRYKICLDVSGSVTSVSPLASIPGADEAIMKVLRQWRFKPQKHDVCFVESFDFLLSRAGAQRGSSTRA